MQQHFEMSDFLEITPSAAISSELHGGRAKCLQRLIRLDLPVPKTVAISFPAVHAIAQGSLPDLNELMAIFGPAPLVCVRPSSLDPDWGGPGAILNIGMNDATCASLAERVGADAAEALYRRFVYAYAVHVARLDPDMFEGRDTSSAELIRVYEDEADEAFPQNPVQQIQNVLQSMARAWEGTTARLLRQAKGAPPDAGLGLVMQAMALGIGPAESGSGVIQFIDADTGGPQITGRYLSQSQGRDAVSAGDAGALFLTKDARGPSLEELCPQIFEALIRHGDVCRQRLREEMQIEFAIEAGALKVLDAVRVTRAPRAALKVAVDLAEDGIISPEEAVLRVDPGSMPELLHRQVDPTAPRDVFASGIAASPGAATGRIVFSSSAAQASEAREEPCILVRRETSPEDIRGMHSSAGVLTERGGTTSHAAVIARGLGLPCVVGCSHIRLDRRNKTLIADDGRVFHEGDVITVDGARGVALAGEAKLLEPALDDTLKTLLSWADEARDIGVRANADTQAEAELALAFEAEGIGLCRTEHMFFDEDRLRVMREMIFAANSEDRAGALERLLPMQRADFIAIFEVMQGKPVCFRLLDPPLHEFLPHGRDGIKELADALDLSVGKIERRIESLTEFNPMLGLRGVRLGIAMPEIYEMQARAIFEATVAASQRGDTVVPEIMIPLVSAVREVELVRTNIDAVAAAVRAESGIDFDYRIGVMVETPRAVLRADEIAAHVSFLSFGTNDLTQMTYGLSRDDAGRFMGPYVNQGVFVEDPFHRLDLDGVGELLMIGAERGRKTCPGVTLSVCGEHGGDPDSIAFCREAGFDYVSCSPFRVPVARLSAAHLALNCRNF